MTYKTHLASGCAASLLLCRPSSLSELILCLGISSVGSVISDVDATTSESKKNLGKTIAVTIAATAAVITADYFTGFDIISRFRNDAAVMRLITGFLIFLGICIFGEHQPHRSFMHSLAGVASVTLSFTLIIPSSAKYMAVSMLSHILIDTLNKRKIQLFYPLSRPRIGFNICYADGIVNKLIFIIAGFYTVVNTAFCLKRFLPEIFANH